MNLSEPFIHRPVATSLLMAGVVLLGMLGYWLLPVSALPQVDFPTIQVTAQFPGASPEVMASSVTTPLERQFGQISGLTAMISTSSFANCAITLQFTLDRDIDAAAQDVQAAINAAGGVLPTNLPNPPVYNKVNPADTPILTLALTSELLPLEKVFDLADTLLAQKLSEVTGVGLVSIQGSQKPAVRVRINPAAIAALGLGLEDVRAALVANNVNAPKGSFDGEQQAAFIGANDQLFSAAQFRPLIVAYRGGAPVRLSDIGEVIDNVENIRMAGWLGDPHGMRPAVLVDIRRQPGANVIETTERIKTLLPQLRTLITPAVELRVLSDQTTTIRASVADVQRTLLLTVALVMLVIFLFLRKLVATVITSVSLPLALIGTFGVMRALGLSLDNLSLMALTIASGFVVDDAIVMIENIVRHIEAGEPPLQAALKGSRQIGFTVISLSLSLVAVFIPLLLMSGIVGRLFREFAITLSIAVGLSVFVSLTLTPMMCAHLLKPTSPRRLTESGSAGDDENVGENSGWIFSRALRFYEHGLRWVLAHQTFTLWVALATLLLTLWLYVVIPKGLLPLQDTGRIVGVTDASQSISFAAMAERQRAVAEIVRLDPDVASVASFVGVGPLNASVNSGRLDIELTPRERRKASAQEIIDRLRRATAHLPGITLSMQAAQDVQIDSRVSRTQYQYTLQSANAEELATWSSRLLQKLQTPVQPAPAKDSSPALADVASDQQPGGLQLHITVDREKASQLSVLTQAIDDVLYDAFGQRQVSLIFTQLNQYRVVLEAEPRFQLSEQSLAHIFVKSTTGAMVPLSAFCTLSTAAAPLVINRLGQFPAVTISFNLPPGGSLGAAEEAIQKAGRDIGLPESIATSFSGSAAEFRTSLQSTPMLILAAVVVIYIVLGVLYESTIHPLTILSSLPSAGVGALLALMLARTDLSLVAFIGIILLIGIVKKNAIMMTTMAALLGALPLALQSGTGAELRRPMGIAIVGGLLLSQFLTLFTTPVIYLALDRVARIFGGEKTANEEREGE